MMEAVVQTVGLNRKVFRRSIRDPRGKVVETLVFNAHEPVLVDDEALLALKDDLGHAIMACTETSSGRYKPDEAATEALKKDVERLIARGRKRTSRKAAASRKAEKPAEEVKPSESERPDEPVHGESVS